MLSSLLLVLLAQITTPPPAAPLDFYSFVLLLVEKPAIVTLIGAFAAVLAATALVIRYYAQKLLANLAVIHTKVDGMQTELLRATEEKAYSAGVDKGAATIAQAVVQPPKVEVTVLPPSALPGGRRGSDPPAPPESPPAEGGPVP